MKNLTHREQLEIAAAVNERQKMLELMEWGSRPISRTPYYIHAAKATWRWGCKMLGALSLTLAMFSLGRIYDGTSYDVMVDLITFICGSVGGGVILSHRNYPRDWWIKSVSNLAIAKEDI